MVRTANSSSEESNLTAYALGELDSRVDERAAVEDLLASSVVARHEVAEIGAMARRLESAYAMAPRPEPTRRISRATIAFATMGLALAASLFLVTNLPAPSLRSRATERPETPTLLGPWAPPVESLNTEPVRVAPAALPIREESGDCDLADPDRSDCPQRSIECE